MVKARKFFYIILFSLVFSFGGIYSQAVFAQAGTPIANAIYPYLQDVTKNSIEIAWYSSASSSGADVSYGLTSSYGSSAKETIEPIAVVSNTSFVHKVLLEGLSTNTAYHFQIRDGSSTSDDSTFITAPEAGAPFDFLVYGDIANNNDNPRTAFYTIAWNEAEAMLAHNPQTIALMLGDHQTGGTDAEWQPQFFLPDRDVLKNTVIYNVFGNHEVRVAQTYDKYFDPPTTGGSDSELYYSFNYGNVHFVVLDGNQSRAVGSLQYKWLLKDLSSTSAQNADFRILATHQPGLAYGGGHAETNDNGFTDAIESLYSVSAIKKNVDLILMGHNHVYERDYKPEGTKSGITWVTVGTVGGNPGIPPTQGEYLKYAGPRGYGYIVLSTTKENISGTYYYTDGFGNAGVTPVVKDTFEIPVQKSAVKKEVKKTEVATTTKKVEVPVVQKVVATTTPVVNTVAVEKLGWWGRFWRWVLGR